MIFLNLNHMYFTQQVPQILFGRFLRKKCSSGLLDHEMTGCWLTDILHSYKSVKRKGFKKSEIVFESIFLSSSFSSLNGLQWFLKLYQIPCSWSKKAKDQEKVKDLVCVCVKLVSVYCVAMHGSYSCIRRCLISDSPSQS